MATTDKNYLVEIHKGITESLEKQIAALPTDLNKQRFIQNCMTVLQDGQSDFSKCQPASVVRKSISFTCSSLSKIAWYKWLMLHLKGIL